MEVSENIFDQCILYLTVGPILICTQEFQFMFLWQIFWFMSGVVIMWSTRDLSLVFN